MGFVDISLLGIRSPAPGVQLVLMRKAKGILRQRVHDFHIVPVIKVPHALLEITQLVIRFFGKSISYGRADPCILRKNFQRRIRSRIAQEFDGTILSRTFVVDDDGSGSGEYRA